MVVGLMMVLLISRDPRNMLPKINFFASQKVIFIGQKILSKTLNFDILKSNFQLLRFKQF